MVTTDLAHSGGSPGQASFLGHTRIACGDLRIERQLSARSLLVCAMPLQQAHEALSRDDLALTPGRISGRVKLEPHCFASSSRRVLFYAQSNTQTP
jgi:hypothetical protein